MAQPRITFIHCLHLAKLNPVLRIGVIAQMVERRNDDLESSTMLVRARCTPLFFSNNDRLLEYVFLGGDPQLERLKRNYSNSVYWFQARFLSLVFYRKGTALKNPTKSLWRLEPDRISNYFFFSPLAHLCAVTCMTEILLIVTLNNQFTSHH